MLLFTVRCDMPSQSKRVLVVDNNDEESQVLASRLESGGYRPTTTWSGIEALSLLKSREFDIVLVSSYLPDLYVGDFFERFNHLPAHPCMIVMHEGQACADTLMKIKDMIGEGIHSEE
jgi:CheY-like chemotaxis protein